jgi:hypothetical protein
VIPKAAGAFDPQKGLPKPYRHDRGDVSLGNASETPTASEGDSPNRGSVDGPLAPEPLPAHTRSGESEMRPKQDDSRTSDGVETFKRMESDAARRRRD